MRAAILYDNLFDRDASTISAAPALPLTPPQTTLRNRHVMRKVRWLGASAYILINLGGLVPIDTVAVMGISGDPLTRVRVSSGDSSGLAGDLYDNGEAADRVSHGMLVALLPAPVSGQYVRVDLAEPGASFIEAGRIAGGVRATPAVTFSPGHNASYIDRSRKITGRGGQTFVDLEDDTPRVWELMFGFLSQAERDGFVEMIDRVNGARRDVLIVRDVAAADLGHNSVWGLLDGAGPIGTPTPIDVYSKSYRIVESL